EGTMSLADHLAGRAQLALLVPADQKLLKGDRDCLPARLALGQHHQTELHESTSLPSVKKGSREVTAPGCASREGSGELPRAREAFPGRSSCESAARPSWGRGPGTDVSCLSRFLLQPTTEAADD